MGGQMVVPVEQFLRQRSAVDSTSLGEARWKVSAASAQPGSELSDDLAGLVDPESHAADGHLAL